ncbi:MAG: alpha/beta fold hydrolase [Deltaproteobacteria bacterium]|nr:alpha/beta fold hydrolase [Deltaproteobacteria bacterium]
MTAMLGSRPLKHFPSWLAGSARQTLATLEAAQRFAPIDGSARRLIVLVPGAFCTSSVMNRLGEELHRRGAQVAVAPSFPYYFSALANLCRLDRAADDLLAWLEGLADKGIVEIDAVGHSNGGLIALLAQQRNGSGRIRITRLVTMATPFGGLPGASALGRLLPCCQDLIDGSDALARAHRAAGIVVRCLVSESDFLVPPVLQFVDGQRRTLMRGFQHTDFIVGPSEKLAQTAEEILRWLPDP